MRHHLALIVALALAGCRTCPEIPDMPQAPEIVRVTVTEYVVPEWLVKPLPEDAPRANTTEEATRLSCVRLYTIQAANCRSGLGARLRKGEPVDAEDIGTCDARAARAARDCEVSE